MTIKPDYETATIHEYAICADCGWPLVDLCCNGPMKEYEDCEFADWFVYCSNKACCNHDGSGYNLGGEPEWVKHT